jgi:F5/8 type C domain
MKVRAFLIPALVAALTFAAPAPAATAADMPADVDQLTWAPPRLVNPVPKTLGTGRTSNTDLDDNTDYIFHMPSTVKTGATIIVGGRNIVIIGGHIRLPVFVFGQTNSADARAIYIKGAKGTVHIEGILIDAFNDQSWGDAIAIDAPEATVQVQNVRVNNLRGMSGLTGFHCDVIQPFGGVKELRVDKLTASSTYQGIFTRRDRGDIGNVKVKRTNLVALPALQGSEGGGQMLWMTEANSDGTLPKYAYSDVYVTPRPGNTLGWAVTPDADDSTPVVIANGFGQWPSMPNVTGGVWGGAPPGGDFVPSGVAGPGYVSPGYNLATTATATASSVHQGNTALNGPAKAIDSTWANNSRWMSAESDTTPTLTLALGATSTIREIAVHSGFNWPTVDPFSVLVDFSVQARVGGVWQTLRQFTGNQAAKAVWTGQVQADAVRLVITDPSRVTPDIARVFELGVYTL